MVVKVQNKNKTSLIELGQAANKVAYAKNNPKGDVNGAMMRLLETIEKADPADWEKFKKISQKNN